MRKVSLAIAVALTLCVLSAAALAVTGGNQNPGIAPPNSSAHGMTYGEWGGVWWNWVLQFPWSGSPFNPADDGSFTMQGQSGPVYFLSGMFGGSAVRSVTIPPGKAIFFPIVNYVDWYPDDGLTEAYLRAKAHAHVDPVSAMTCTIDGKAVNDLWAYRGESPAGGFAIELPAGSLLSDAPWSSPLCISDGYWLMVEPLTPGAHTLRFACASPTVSLDMSYNITVQQPGKK